MPQERREKALAILASGVDEARWAEVRPRDREKRREVMAKLEEILYGKEPTTEGGDDGVDARLPLPDEILKLYQETTQIAG